MDRKKQALILMDHSVNGLSYRSLGRKYGIPISTLHKMLNKKQQKQAKREKSVKEEVLPDDINTLKEELRKAKLKIGLQDLMIDIASKELGVDIRKKSGTRQSE